MRYLALALTLVTTATFAQAERCNETEAAFKHLSKKYNEKMVVVAKSATNDDHMISIWINEENGTGTIIKTSVSENISCVTEAMELSRKVDQKPSY